MEFYQSESNVSIDFVKPTFFDKQYTHVKKVKKIKKLNIAHISNYNYVKVPMAPKVIISPWKTPGFRSCSGYTEDI